MKKLIMMLMASAGLWMTGCQKNDSSMTPTDETVAYEEVTSAAARYSATLDSVTTTKCKGKLTEVAVADLSSTISSYISTTYPGSTVQYAATDATGKVVVAITLADGTAKGLLFNADGTFEQELARHSKKAKLTKVEISALPEAITTYISTNYAGAETKQAGTNADGEYFVEIVVDSKPKVLLFNADGSFNKELERPAFRPGKPGHGKGK